MGWFSKTNREENRIAYNEMYMRKRSEAFLNNMWVPHIKVPKSEIDLEIEYTENSIILHFTCFGEKNSQMFSKSCITNDELLETIKEECYRNIIENGRYFNNKYDFSKNYVKQMVMKTEIIKYSRSQEVGFLGRCWSRI